MHRNRILKGLVIGLGLMSLGLILLPVLVSLPGISPQSNAWATKTEAVSFAAEAPPGGERKIEKAETSITKQKALSPANRPHKRPTV